MRLATSIAACAFVAVAEAFSAAAAEVDFDFTISYSGASISGRLEGLHVDASGNATDADPARVLLYHVPSIVGLTASPSHPYVFVPRTFERSTLFNGTLVSTMPGVYGFRVSGYSISPPQQNLLIMDAGRDVTLVFNFGASLGGEGGVATYGIQGEEDALWPAINTRVTFTLVEMPCYADYDGNGGIDGTDVAAFFEDWERGAGAADVNRDGGVDGGDVATFFAAWEAGAC